MILWYRQEASQNKGISNNCSLEMIQLLQLWLQYFNIQNLLF